MWYMGGVCPARTDEADWCRHIFREHNTVADMHANWLMDNVDSGAGAQWETAGLCAKLQKARYVVVSFDGARRGSGLRAASLVLLVHDKAGPFEKVSRGGRVLRDNSAIVAEREAQQMGIERLAVLMPRKVSLFDFEIENWVELFSTNLTRSLCGSSVNTEECE